MPRQSALPRNSVIGGDDIHGASGLAKLRRSGEFWARTVSIYASFKARPPLYAALPTALDDQAIPYDMLCLPEACKKCPQHEARASSLETWHTLCPSTL